MSVGWRSDKMDKMYQTHKKSGAMDDDCVLCAREPRKVFEHWKIIENRFPYDLVAETHDMIIPKRHITEIDITTEEWQEYEKIKTSELYEYDFIVESTPRNKSFPPHFHLHLIATKEIME